MVSMRRIHGSVWVLGFGWLCGCGGAATTASSGGTVPEGAEPEVTYTVRPSADQPTEATVRACFSQIALTTTPPTRNIRDVRPSAGGEALLVSEEGSVDLRGLASGDCVDYGVTLPVDQIASFGGAEAGFWAGSPEALLLVPHTAPRDTPVSITFVLPDGITALSPWPREGERHRTRVQAVRSATLIGWGRGLAQGAVDDDDELGWTLLPGSRWQADDVASWLGEAARGAKSIFGRFPFARWTVVVAPVPDADEPVAFDYLAPGDGGLVVVRVDASLSAADLRRHESMQIELLRLSLPALVGDDAWLSDGLVGYYREMNAARHGHQPADQVFRHLHVMLAAFHARADQPSRDEVTALSSGHAQAYRGVAVALLADIELRRAGSSLDAQLAAAFGDRGRRQSTRDAGQALAALDEGLERPVFGPLAAAVRGDASREMRLAYHRLGMAALRRGRVDLRRRPDAVELRQAMVRPQMAPSRPAPDAPDAPDAP